jgi:dTDP-4-dehydrorhamnose reductase
MPSAEDARIHNFLRNVFRLAHDRDDLFILADQIGTPSWARPIAGATVFLIQCAGRERIWNRSSGMAAGVDTVYAA